MSRFTNLATLPLLDIGLGTATRLTDEPTVDLNAFDPTPTGFDLRIRGMEHWDDDEPPGDEEEASPADLFEDEVDDEGLGGFDVELRGVSDGGTLVLDRLRLRGILGQVRIRPELGDDFEVDVFGGTRHLVLFASSGGFGHVAAYLPGRLTLLGFSNTDQDKDSKLKHFFGIGAGLGADAQVRLVGPIGIRLRPEFGAETFNRHRAGSRNPTRHEVWLDGDVGLSWFLEENRALSLTGWVEHRSQWEPRDAGGSDGVDRQQMAGGVRVTLQSWAPQWGSDPVEI